MRSEQISLPYLLKINKVEDQQQIEVRIENRYVPRSKCVVPILKKIVVNFTIIYSNSFSVNLPPSFHENQTRPTWRRLFAVFKKSETYFTLLGKHFLRWFIMANRRFCITMRCHLPFVQFIAKCEEFSLPLHIKKILING